eukprot:5224998-Pyramimonas_sp.AAC.1
MSARTGEFSPKTYGSQNYAKRPLAPHVELIQAPLRACWGARSASDNRARATRRRRPGASVEVLPKPSPPTRGH